MTLLVPRSPWEIAADIFDPPPDPYFEKPLEWGKDKLGRAFWSKQREILLSIKDNRRTAVHSSHGVGKTQVAADAVSWWLDSHPPGQTFAVTTAPTHDQVAGALWRYIGQNHEKGDLVGRIVDDTKWKLGKELIGYGRSPQKPAKDGGDQTVTAFQGFHAKYVLVVLDEACGIPPALWAAAKSLTTGEHCRILAIGNPDDPSSEFEKVCREESGWNVIHISTFDTPYFTGEQVPLEMMEKLPNDVWLEEQKLDYPEDSALFTAKVLGQFPTDVSDAVIPWSWAAKCRHLELQHTPEEIVTLGCDIGAGVDETVIAPRQGRVFGQLRRSRSEDPMDAVDEIVTAIGDYRRMVTAPVNGITVRVNIDAIGVGWGVEGGVKREVERKGWRDVEVNAVQVSEQASRPEQYKNLRAELWWMGREALHDELWDIGMLDEKCMTELTTPTWWENSSGRTEVESRESIVKKLKRSPDSASAVLLAGYVPVVEAGTLGNRPLQNRALRGRR